MSVSTGQLACAGHSQLGPSQTVVNIPVTEVLLFCCSAVQSPALNAALTSLLSNVGASAIQPGMDPCSRPQQPAAATAAQSEPSASAHGSTQQLLGSGAGSEAPSGPQQPHAAASKAKNSRSSRVSGPSPACWPACVACYCQQLLGCRLSCVNCLPCTPLRHGSVPAVAVQ
jgi:hypothetical protein